MKRELILRHEFVEYIPHDLKEGTIYVSTAFATVAHKCCCGCGNEVITPLSPTDWRVTFDGEAISLDPSIGNWNFACKSHYWIENNRVGWAARWSQEKIDAGRAYDQLAKRRYFERKEGRSDTRPEAEAPQAPKSKSQANESLWSKLKKWWS